MPPTRRKPSAPSTRSQQPPLSFGPTNKITKPTPPTRSKDLTNPKPFTPEEIPHTPSPPPEQPQQQQQQQQQKEEKQQQPPPPPSPTTSLAIRPQPPPLTTPSITASRIPQAQIHHYWKTKEETRIAPRVHQGGITVHEKILREFDLSSQYGPCVGLTRHRRWKRAHALGLRPPLEVLAVLQREEEGGNAKAGRAFVEGLLASRGGGGE